MILQGFYFATDSLKRDFLLCFQNSCAAFLYTPQTVLRWQDNNNKKITIQKIITLKINLTTFVFLNVDVVQYL